MQEEIKQKILTKALKIVPFDGWSSETLETASIKSGYDASMAKLLFPEGPTDAIEYYLNNLDKKMVEKTRTLPLKQMKVREKVIATIEARLDLVKNNKLLFNRTISYMALPFNAPTGMKFNWRTVDTIWHEIVNDPSTDFNYYTKRMLLVGVYTSTLLYWINDDSKDLSATKGYLSRRIDDILKVGGFIGKLKKHK